MKYEVSENSPENLAAVTREFGQLLVELADAENAQAKAEEAYELIDEIKYETSLDPGYPNELSVSLQALSMLIRYIDNNYDSKPEGPWEVPGDITPGNLREGQPLICPTCSKYIVSLHVVRHARTTHPVSRYIGDSGRRSWIAVAPKTQSLNDTAVYAKPCNCELDNEQARMVIDYLEWKTRALPLTK